MAAELEQLRVSLVAELVGREAFEQLKREVNQVKSAIEGLDTTQQKVRQTTDAMAGAVRQQRQAFAQTGMQINQFAGQVAAGTPVMTAFVQQIGDVAYVMGQAGGAGGKLAAFLQGPFAAAILVAVSVLGPLIAKLFDTKKATEELEKIEDLKRETTLILRDATLDYNLAVAKTPVEQRKAMLAILAASEADMDSANTAVRSAQIRVIALKAEIAAINARTEASIRGSLLMGGEGPNLAGGGAALVGTIQLKGATDALREAELSLQEVRKASANAYGKMRQAYGRLVQFDQQQEDAGVKSAQRLQREYEKAQKAAEKLAKKEEDLYQKFIGEGLKDTMKALEDYSKAYSSTTEDNVKAAADAFAAQNALKEQIKDYKFGEQMEDQFKAIDRIKSMSESMGQAFSDGIKGMITGAMNFKQVMSNVVDAVINKLFEMFVVQQIVGFISKGISAVTGIQLKPRAIGGPVQAGGAYMVGERGPEMFVPSRSGSIVPNGGMGGMVVNVDARGSADPAAVRAQVEMGIAQAAPYIIAAAQNRTLKTAGRTRLPGTIG